VLIPEIKCDFTGDGKTLAQLCSTLLSPDRKFHFRTLQSVHTIVAAKDAVLFIAPLVVIQQQVIEVRQHNQ
jgi:hypothetical protein